MASVGESMAGRRIAAFAVPDVSMLLRREEEVVKWCQTGGLAS
jgi:hypothetical protein